MNCGVPFCQSDFGCPLHNLIPEWNDLLYRGQEKEALKRLLRENQEYLDNYLELYSSLEDDEYVARGNGFCDRKFSDDFIEGQIEKYRARVGELERWLKRLL